MPTFDECMDDAAKVLVREAVRIEAERLGIPGVIVSWPGDVRATDG